MERWPQGHLSAFIMKKIILLILLCLVSFGTEAKKDKTIRILAIGNSFSVDALEQHLHDLAAAEGIDVIIGDLYIGGCSLKKHLINASKDKHIYSYRKIGLDGVKVVTDSVSISDALADEKWDYISFQQASRFSGKYETWEESLPALVDYVKARSSRKVKLMIHQTWAYDQTSTSKGFENYDNDQIKMYNAIVDAVDRAAKLVGIDIVIPCGTAIQNARSTVLKDAITRDGQHLHRPNGRYVAACTWFETVFGKSVVGNPYKPEGMTEEQQLAAQQSAHAAVEARKR